MTLGRQSCIIVPINDEKKVKRKIYYDYLEELDDEKKIKDGKNNDTQYYNSPHMTQFKQMFELGIEESGGRTVGQWYVHNLLLKANNFYFDSELKRGKGSMSVSEAFKKAKESMEDVLAHLNPNKTPISGKTKKTRIKQAQAAAQFKKYLDKYPEKELWQGLIDVQDKYVDRKDNLIKSVNDYLLESNLVNDFKDYGIPIVDLFK